MLSWKDFSVFESGSGHCLAHYEILRRHGAVVPFEPNKIAHAMMKGFMAVQCVLAFAQRVCSGWVHGLWRALKPSKINKHVCDRATRLDRPNHSLTLQAQSWQQGFFGSTKPDMHNAP
jgi:hypothetical protein